MELEIFEALTSANVSPEKARTAAASIKKEINEHYALHAAQLATKGDLAEMEARLLRSMQDMQRWTITILIAAGGLFAAISKVWH
jgi:hypothetical protein